MGNICTSSKNSSYREDERSKLNTESNTLLNGDDKEIDKWDVDDVYSWLSQIELGVLKDLAIKFKESRIRGRVLDSVTEPQLIEMGIPLGDRILFQKVKSELFSKYNYIPNNILMDNNSNPTPIHGPPDIANQSHCSNHSVHSHHSSGGGGHEHDGHDGHSSAVLLPLPSNINISNPNSNVNLSNVEGEGGMSIEEIINETTTTATIATPYHTLQQQQQQQIALKTPLHPTYPSHSSHPIHRARQISMPSIQQSPHSTHNTQHSPIQQPISQHAMYYQAIQSIQAIQAMQPIQSIQAIQAMPIQPIQSIQHQAPITVQPRPQRTMSNPIHSHSRIPSIPSISHMPSTALTALTSSSSHQSSPDDTLPIVDENQYSAVDPKLIEGIEDFMQTKDEHSASPKEDGKHTESINGYHVQYVTPSSTHKITKKPPLARSCSADEYKKQQNQLKQIKVKAKNHQFKSISNPILPNRQNGQIQAHDDSKCAILKIAKYLKTSMENELKTVDEIREILQKHLCDDIDNNIKNKNYQQIYDELLTLKLLTFANCNNGEIKTEKLLFNHSVYNKMITNDESHSKHSKHSKSCSNIPNIHVNTDRKYCGGTQVIVYSPKSNKWRQGLILKFNESTSTGRICCYNSMGKQSIKDLTLPNVHVKPFVDHHYSHIATNNMQQKQSQQPPIGTSIIQQPQNNHFPMTVDSWNNYIRDGQQHH